VSPTVSRIESRMSCVGGASMRVLIDQVLHRAAVALIRRR
jgi:hypothetical protein